MKNKGTLGVLTLCLVGAVAFATYRAGYDSSSGVQPDAAVTQESETTAADLEAAGADVVAELPQVNDYTAANEKDVDPASLAVPEEEETEEAQEEPAADVSSPSATAVLQPTVNFQDDSLLAWPAAGTVLMDYNMNNTVYFKTLNQYKYNPALIISSEAGNPVVASAKGIVESIGVNEETGTTLKLNLGNNYSLVYGQLKELAVSEGDVVEQGQLLGYVSEPTRYYCEEGSNLYFQMQKDGQPVDPYLYLE
ncbi:M23 family metallopeptidase [Marvinbryantia formatexigens]|uniref:M23 family metallopeptidase n=1 Tax=Marvinbryantia formatexigens TaxID=168384 RepID=UPI001A9A546C|nr:M23 family metallopeptidase [Marvinbryantia formatexigens]